MNVGFFLNERIAFIRQFYNAASFPFVEQKRKIEAEEDPFVPPYGEDDEPPFLHEWIEAEKSLQVLGYSCISMLAAALHLYLRTWEAQLGVPAGDSFKAEFKKGWLNGYKAYLAAHFGIQFDQGPADLSVLEEIVLARNRIQHPEKISIQRASYSYKDLKKLSQIFFVDEKERIPLSELGENDRSWLFLPNIHITRDKLAVAIAEVEKFSGWLEVEITSRVYSK